MRWRFYVYALKACNAVTAYVGKGSGRRLRVQMKKFGLSGEIIAHCKSDRDAYRLEVEKIAELKPLLNKHPGGNGPALKRRPRKLEWEVEMDRIGTRAYSARVLLRYAYLFNSSEVEAIRLIAYG